MFEYLNLRALLVVTAADVRSSMRQPRQTGLPRLLIVISLKVPNVMAKKARGGRESVFNIGIDENLY